MDGTITRPLLDFDQIRSEIGITGPILEAIKKMNDSDRQRAFKILDQHEISAANASTLNDGCLELMKLIDRMNFRTALITRNSRANVEIVLSLHGLRFDLIVTRDDAPPKPNPTALIQTVRNFKLNVNDCWMIGDGPHDIDAAMACNMRSIWLQHDETELLDSKPWKIVRSLHELADFINSLTSSHRV